MRLSRSRSRSVSETLTDKTCLRALQAVSKQTQSGSTMSRFHSHPAVCAAQIKREFISARTKEALERRKAAGLPVDRPKGRATKLMLDDRRAEIVDYLNKGVSKRSVAKILGCSPTTLYSWIRRRRISGR